LIRSLISLLIRGSIKINHTCITILCVATFFTLCQIKIVKRSIGKLPEAGSTFTAKDYFNGKPPGATIFHARQ